MQAIGGRQTRALRGAFLFRPFDRREKDNSGTRLVGGSSRYEKLEIGARIAQSAQFVRQSAGTIRDLSGPHIYLLDRVRHGYTSLKKFLNALVR
jgi:hypothetical protein